MAIIHRKLKTIPGLFLAGTLLLSCDPETKATASEPAGGIRGTWKLLSGTIIERGDTTVTDYTQNRSFIKIINDTHFAFLQHDLKGGKDSTAVFVSGGGRYTLTGSAYTEHLEYCSERAWEGHDFTFQVRVSNDTLVQSGMEKLEAAGVEINRENIEKYVRVKE